MQQWIIFGLLSAFTAGLVAIFAKVGLSGIDTNTATAIRAVIMALFLVGVAVVQGKLSNLQGILGNSKAMMFIVLSGIAGALSWLFYFIALKSGKASQVAPIDRLSVVFVVVMAFLFLGERPNTQAIAGTGLIALGALLIALA